MNSALQQNVLREGTFIPFKARFFATFVSWNGSEQSIVHAAWNLTEFDSGNFSSSGVLGSRTVKANPALHMASIRNDDGKLVHMEEWSISLWVKSKTGVTGQLLHAPQDHGNLLVASGALVVLQWNTAIPMAPVLN